MPGGKDTLADARGLRARQLGSRVRRPPRWLEPSHHALSGIGLHILRALRHDVGTGRHGASDCAVPLPCLPGAHPWPSPRRAGVHGCAEGLHRVAFDGGHPRQGRGARGTTRRPDGRRRLRSRRLDRAEHRCLRRHRGRQRGARGLLRHGARDADLRRHQRVLSGAAGGQSDHRPFRLSRLPERDATRRGARVWSIWSSADDVVGFGGLVWGTYTSRIPGQDGERDMESPGLSHLELRDDTTAEQLDILAGP
jgi:hypothetical protein